MGYSGLWHRQGFWIFSEDHKSEVPFSRHHVNGTYYQHSLSLVRLTLITRFLHCKDINPQLHLTFKCRIFGNNSLCAAHIQECEIMLHLLSGITYIIICNFSVWKKCVYSPLFLYLFNNYLYQYGHMDTYILGYNMILCYLFCFSNFSSFGHLETFWLDPVFLGHTPLLYFLNIYFLSLQDTLGLLCIFLASDLELAISSRSLCS